MHIGEGTLFPCRWTVLGVSLLISQSTHNTIMMKTHLTGVSAMGLWSFRLDTAGVFGTGMMVDVLRPDGTLAWDTEVLNMSARTSDSWSAQSFRILPGITSGPKAFLGLTLCSVLLTTAVVMVKTGVSSGEGVSREGVVVLEASKRAKKGFKLSGSARSSGHCASLFLSSVMHLMPVHMLFGSFELKWPFN